MEVTNFQLITMSLAVIGAVLGIINTWYNLDRSRIKLRVTPAKAIPVGSANPSIEMAIEIINTSAFPVSIAEAGLNIKGSNQRFCIITPIFPDGGQWPKRLEPRSSLTVYSQLPEMENRHLIKNAYCKTQCGVVVTGTSPSLKKITNNA